MFLKSVLKVKVSEDFIESGIDDHTFDPANVKKHFPEDEFTLGENRLLEVDSLMVWEWMELFE